MWWMRPPPRLLFFFLNDTATTEIYTLSLHDALPILIPDREAAVEVRQADRQMEEPGAWRLAVLEADRLARQRPEDRKSTRLNSSHLVISYAVFCLKKKNNVGTNTASNHDSSPDVYPD